MSSFVTEARELIYPRRDSDHGPLGLLVLCLTFTSGLVDSFSYLVLGHVFVGNQTGNFILLGLALAGAHGFSASAQTVALISFAIGAAIGGRLRVGRLRHRGRYLAAAGVGEVVFLIVGVVLSALATNPPPNGYRYALIFILAVAMGIQTASARKLAVPDLTTTTFTQLITATMIDSTLAGGKGSQIGRRIMPFAAILGGAVVGTLFVVAGHIVPPLFLASAVTGAVAATAWLLRRSTGRWASFSR
jgi:uncharacterized membrane protein YoaK (UPF0700 family)